MINHSHELRFELKNAYKKYCDYVFIIFFLFL